MKVVVAELKTLSVKEYLDDIKSYLKDINNLKKKWYMNIQLTIAILTLFLLKTYIDEERVIRSKSDKNHDL